MKNITFFLAFFSISLLGTFFVAKENSQKQNPCSYFVLQKEGFSVGYDGRLKQASWVFEELTQKSLTGEAERNQYHFSPDNNIPKTIRSLLSDYKDCGYDRGHLAPAANHVCRDKEMADTFLLSNVSPQSPGFNRGYWAKLEKHVRSMAKEHTQIKIITGPLFLPEQSQNGKRYISYEIIGANDIAVPTHFFKIVWTPKTIEAYILPNKKISPDTPLESFKTTIEKIEKSSGVVLSQVLN